MNNSRPKKLALGKAYAKKIGDWDKAIRFFSNLGFDISDSVKRATKEEADGFKRALVRAIVTQQYAGTPLWPPLKPRTRYRKKDNKNKIYMDTEKYVNSILVRVENGVYSVGFRKGVTYKRKGQRTVTIDQVARWMEYGTSTSPARPLWAPTLRKRGGTRGIRDRIADKLYRKLKRLAAGTGIQINRRDIRTRF